MNTPKLRTNLLVIAALILSQGTVSWAQQGGRSFHIEEAQQRFFDHWQSARTFALGGAAVVTAADATSLMGNPAGLAWVDEVLTDISYDYNQTGAKEETSEYQHIGTAAVAVPSRVFDGDWGTLGFGWSGMQGGPRDFPINSEHRVKSAHLAYALSLSEDLSVGYDLTWTNNQVYSNIYNYEMSRGFRNTVGVQKKAGDLTIGLFGFYGHGKYDSNFFEIDSRSSTIDQYGIDLGASYDLSPVKLFLAFDYSEYESEGGFANAPIDIALGGDESGSAYTPKFGAELAVNDWLTARAGCRYLIRRHFFARDELRSLRGNANAFAWSAGVGINLPLPHSPRIDAALEERQLGVGNRQVIVALSLPLTM